MKNTGGESLPAEGRNYAGTSINNENPAPPSTHREKVTLLRGSLARIARSGGINWRISRVDAGSRPFAKASQRAA